MEPQQASNDNQNTVHVEGSERLRSSNASSSSSSTRSSEFEDPDQTYPLETGRTTSKKDHDRYREQGRREADFQTPPVQTMERPTGSSGYRIPSSVFARNKSGNPGDWSAASNESLFSIRNGNMSFTGDQFNWLTKSGELYHVDNSDLPATPKVPPTPNVNEDLHGSEQQIASVQTRSKDHPAHISFDLGTNEPNHGHKEVITSATATATGNENVRHGKNVRGSMGDEQATPTSSRSNASGQSFAFPVLEGGGSVKSGPKSGQMKSGHQQKSQNEARTPAPEANNASVCSWFGSCVSWFPCHPKTEKNVHANG